MIVENNKGKQFSKGFLLSLLIVLILVFLFGILDFANGISCPIADTSASGILSVSSTSLKIEQYATFTIKAQDNQGVEKVCLDSNDGYRSCQFCNLSCLCTKTWPITRLIPGDYTFSGTVTGRLLDGSPENSSTFPSQITLNFRDKVPELQVSCQAIPSSTDVNQRVRFSSNIFGGTGFYNFYWSGSCQSNSRDCEQTFNWPGTFTATITVSSGSQSKSASCSVWINDNRFLECSGNDVFRFFPAHILDSLAQDCGEDFCRDLGSNFCQGNNVVRQRTCFDRGCANASCFSNAFTDTQIVQTCGLNQACSNGQCISACACSSGPCCDGCNFKSSAAVCDTKIRSEFTCVNGTGCGADVFRQVFKQVQQCSGQSAQCNGPVSGFFPTTSLTVYDNCSKSQVCTPGIAACQISSRCPRATPKPTPNLLPKPSPTPVPCVVCCGCPQPTLTPVANVPTQNVQNLSSLQRLLLLLFGR